MNDKQKQQMAKLNTISNGEISITVSTAGAEMQNLKVLAGEREMLWQGIPEYWHGRSPILFPAVGGLWNGTYRLNGKSYRMPKHGFMREKEWTLEEETADSLTYVYKDCGENREAFPWPYEVRVRYALEGRRVKATMTVLNLGDSTMFFQMGGHPGFVLPDFDEDAAVDGYLKLEGKNISHVLRATEQGCTEPQHFDFPQEADGLVPLGVDTFANEALIFDEHQIERAVVLDKAKRPLAAVKSSARRKVCTRHSSAPNRGMVFATPSALKAPWRNALTSTRPNQDRLGLVFMRLKCSSEQVETDDGQRWHIIGFHTTASLWPSSLNRKRPRQHSIREKAQDAPLQGASCAFLLFRHPSL